MTLGYYGGSNVYRKFLHNVQRTNHIDVGAFCACDGSWNRRGEIVEVVRHECPKGTKAKIHVGCWAPVALIPVTGYVEAKIRFVGRYWADGRYAPAVRPTTVTKRFWYKLDGTLIQESGWVPVRPRAYGHRI